MTHPLFVERPVLRLQWCGQCHSQFSVDTGSRVLFFTNNHRVEEAPRDPNARCAIEGKLSLEHQFDLAAQLVTVKFAGILDKAGAPYVFHLFTVAYRCKRLFDRVVALLHDIIEDTDVTADELLGMGFWAEIVAAVVAITKLKGEPYETYIMRVLANESATLVKVEDTGHNSEVGRFAEPTDDQRRTSARYAQRHHFLREQAQARGYGAGQ